MNTSYNAYITEQRLEAYKNKSAAYYAGEYKPFKINEGMDFYEAYIDAYAACQEVLEKLPPDYQEWLDRVVDLPPIDFDKIPF